jgi:hypothetical protein
MVIKELPLLISGPIVASTYKDAYLAYLFYLAALLAVFDVLA